MDNILTPDKVKELSASLKIEHQSIVLVGGCFYILHPGHIAFLGNAKAYGDHLILLLESDESVRRRKGEKRPINTSYKRAKILLEKTSVDTIIQLPFPFVDRDYDKLVSSLKPAIIATTKGDPYIHHKIRQGELIGAKVVEVINRLPEHSTTNILNN